MESGKQKKNERENLADHLDFNETERGTFLQFCNKLTANATSHAIEMNVSPLFTGPPASSVAGRVIRQNGTNLQSAGCYSLISGIGLIRVAVRIWIGVSDADRSRFEP
jgi:hypothetical protein